VTGSLVRPRPGSAVHVAAAAAYERPVMFVDGSWQDGADGAAGAASVVDPATGEQVSSWAGASVDQVEAACGAAARAFPAWAGSRPELRAEVLRGAADHLEADLDSAASTMTVEQGKTLAEARAEFVSIVELFRWFADRASGPASRQEPGSVPGGRVEVQHLPVGPVAVMTPWNFPASLAARKVAAAFAVGCTAVVKPALETPASFLVVARALQAAGLPPGVLSVVNGDPARTSSALIASQHVRAVSFTGSTAVGRLVARAAADRLVHTTLELGGHAPVVVTEDVDVTAVARSIAATKFRNAGQVCIAPTRFLVAATVYDEFVDEFTRFARGLRVAPGLLDGAQMGPMALERRRTALLDLVDRSVLSGAELVCGGEADGDDGWFVQPTVLTQAPAGSPVMNEEPFGPVAVINPVRTDDEAVLEANRLSVGLAGYVFTRDAIRGRSLAARLDVGTVGINTGVVVHRDSPLGGVKDSGWGSDGGLEGMREFQHAKAVSTGA